MIDGADQAKFRIMKCAKWNKDFDSEHRPRVQVVGCLVHGFECSFNMREENLEKGSCMAMEVLTRALDRTLAMCAERHIPFPSHLWIQTDNASSEFKNQWLARYCATLVDRGVFRSVVQSFLMVGHTHEDLDSIFGVMSTHIASQLEWNTPQEMIGRLG